MPLYPGAEQLIRSNLAALKRGLKPRWVTIGCLTGIQLRDINCNWLPIESEIVFFGNHVYGSRIVEDGIPTTISLRKSAAHSLRTASTSELLR